jgi:hypothetical protein
MPPQDGGRPVDAHPQRADATPEKMVVQRL